jgi:hypothetical protein
LSITLFFLIPAPLLPYEPQRAVGLDRILLRTAWHFRPPDVEVLMNKPLVVLAGAVLCAAATREMNLADLYRAGPIVIRTGEDWTANLPPDLFFESRGDVAVAPDGSVFVSNTIRHTVYKFDPEGRFVKSFGQKGLGPGDLTYPGRLSVLDGRYLVVGEYATNQRLSLFDLDGTFVKIVSTGRFTSQAVALGDGKIAYVSVSGRMGPTEMVNQCKVFVIDWQSGAQSSIAGYEIRMPITQTSGGNIIVSGAGGVLLARAGEGLLVVGATDRPDLDIFTAEGLKVRTIETGWKPIPVTSKYRNGYQALQRELAAAAGREPPPKPSPLPDVLDVLQDVWADDQGNILVCRKTDCLKDCALLFRVYSSAGEHLCDFELQPGPFSLQADHRFKKVVINSRGLYALLELKDDPDGFLHLVRMGFSPAGNAGP